MFSMRVYYRVFDMLMKKWWLEQLMLSNKSRNITYDSDSGTNSAARKICYNIANKTREAAGLSFCWQKQVHCIIRLVSTNLNTLTASQEKVRKQLGLLSTSFLRGKEPKQHNKKLNICVGKGSNPQNWISRFIIACLHDVNIEICQGIMNKIIGN